MTLSFTRLALISTVAFLTACGGGSDDEPTTVYNRTETISEGYQLSLTLPAGTYRAEITASNNGVGINWVGGTACSNDSEVRTYAADCTMSAQGQLVISNPTLLGLGGSEIVTIKVTKR